jgi:hypothetical protein
MPAMTSPAAAKMPNARLIPGLLKQEIKKQVRG